MCKPNLNCTAYFTYLFQYCDSHGISKSNWCTVNDNGVIRQLSIFLLLLVPSLSLWLRIGELRQTRARGIITSTVFKSPVASAAINGQADERG